MSGQLQDAVVHHFRLLKGTCDAKRIRKTGNVRARQTSVRMAQYLSLHVFAHLPTQTFILTNFQGVVDVEENADGEKQKKKPPN